MYIIPIDLDNLPATWEICGFQDKLASYMLLETHNKPGIPPTRCFCMDDVMREKCQKSIQNVLSYDGMVNLTHSAAKRNVYAHLVLMVTSFFFSFFFFLVALSVL